MSELFAPVCSITTTKRRRFFWAAWWSGPPTRVPFKKPDASDGGAATREEAVAAAEKRAGARLVAIDPLWARAWIRILRGEHPWPSKASREPSATREQPERATDVEGADERSYSSASGTGLERSERSNASVWQILGVTREVTEAELKAAYRRRALETHPDHGGDQQTFRRVVHAYAEAQRRLRKPRPAKSAGAKARSTK